MNSTELDALIETRAHEKPRKRKRGKEVVDEEGDVEDSAGPSQARRIET
jgi:hypothetical protein